MLDDLNRGCLIETDRTYVHALAARLTSSSTEPPQGSPTDTSPNILTLIQEYGGCMERYAGSTADTSVLPAPKERIKQAILTALLAANDQKIRDILECGYLGLANFQDGVGSHPIRYPGSDPNFNKLDIDSQAATLANHPYFHWLMVTQKEFEALMLELKALRQKFRMIKGTII